MEEGTTFQTLVSPVDPQEKLLITGYKDHPVKRWVFYLLTVTLGGLPWLLTKWYPKFNALRCSKISLKDAQFVLIKVNEVIS